AAQTQYDFGRVFGRSGKKAIVEAQLGAEELTGNYADPRPFTERHPNLLWIALGLAIVLLGYAALRALRTPGPAASSEDARSRNRSVPAAGEHQSYPPV